MRRNQLMRLALENAFVNVSQPPSHDDALIMSFRKEFGHLYPTPPVVIVHNPIDRPYLAMEEIANGQPVKEIEHTIYARVVNMSDLEQAASSEEQEQWEIRIEKTDQNAGKGSMRVRKTWHKGQEAEAVYVRTNKVSMNEKGDKIELPFPSNKDEFTLFKFLASQGMRKTRFTFPIVGTNLKWEIDMFPKADGSGFHEWCKIDLEVQDREQPIPEFPIALDDVILPEGYGRNTDAELDAQVRGLYDTVFLLKNEFIQKPTTDAAVGSANDQGLTTSVPAPTDTPVAASSPSDEAPEPVAPATPAPAAPGAAPHEQLSQSLDEPLPDNLQAPPPEPVTDPTAPAADNAPEPNSDATAIAEPITADDGQNDTTAEVPNIPNGAEPNGSDATPEQAADNQQPDGFATKPEQTPDAAVADASATPGAGTDAQADQVDANSTDEIPQAEVEADQAQTQAKVDQIQSAKKAEAQSQGEPDPTEDGKVPVDLIDNPQGDPSVAQAEPDAGDAGTGGETDDAPGVDDSADAGSDLEDGAGTSGNTTGAADLSNPDENGAGTGDGLGGELPETGTTGTVETDPDDTTTLNADGEDATASTSSDAAEGANSQGKDNAEVNGEDQLTANAPQQAAAGEVQPENPEEQRPKQGEASIPEKV